MPNYTLKCMIISDILNLMSRIRLIGAFFISIASIAGASWFRFIQIPPYQRAELVAVEEIADLTSDDVFLEDILSSNPNTSDVSATPLTQTDVVGRQLFSDYISLASQNKTSSDDFNFLATKYAESILRETPKKVTRPDELSITTNSEENLRIYGNAVLEIRTKYRNLVIAQYQGGNISNVNGPEFKSLVKNTSFLYGNAARELLALPVPASLANNHAALINNYFASAEAMRELSNISEDPIKSFAALNTQAKNSQEEEDLFLKIQMMLAANGITFERGI